MERKPVVVGLVMIAFIARSALGGPAGPERRAVRGPLALATADLDEDGVPEILAAFAEGAAGGTIHIHRGRPGTPSASARAALPTAAAFDPSIATHDVSMAPDFVVTGDFDADGHADAVIAGRRAAFLTMLVGDGTGALAAPRQLSLPGSLDALAAGDVNRTDGLFDLVAAVSTPSGSRLEIFESPEGAFRATPEEIKLPDRAVAVAIADLDGDFVSDVVVATSTTLVIVSGRDRRLAGSRAEQAQVKPAVVRSIPLKSASVAMTVGRFMADDTMGIALLDEDGVVTVAAGRSPDNARALAGRYPGASRLASGHVRGGFSDDLIVLDRLARRLHLVRPDEGTDVALDVEGEPAAVLPMRLDADALDDLAILRDAGGADPLVAAMTSVQSTFVVTNRNDSGAGSLRQAILDANNNSGPDTITFNVPGSGIVIILPLSPLPALSGSVTLDGTTQPGYVGSPRVEIDGTAAGPGTDGLTLNLGDNVVRGLDVHGFQGSAVVINGGSHNVVEACYLGTDPTGGTGIANGDAGVLIRNSHLNTIGGTKRDLRKRGARRGDRRLASESRRRLQRARCDDLRSLHGVAPDQHRPGRTHHVRLCDGQHPTYLRQRSPPDAHRPRRHPRAPVRVQRRLRRQLFQHNLRRPGGDADHRRKRALLGFVRSPAAPVGDLRNDRYRDLETGGPGRGTSGQRVPLGVEPVLPDGSHIRQRDQRELHRNRRRRCRRSCEPQRRRHRPITRQRRRRHDERCAELDLRRRGTGRR
jgi:hypothetical protein